MTHSRPNKYNMYYIVLYFANMYEDMFSQKSLWFVHFLKKNLPLLKIANLAENRGFYTLRISA